MAAEQNENKTPSADVFAGVDELFLLKRNRRIVRLLWTEGSPAPADNFGVWHTFDTAGEFIVMVKKQAKYFLKSTFYVGLLKCLFVRKQFRPFPKKPPASPVPLFPKAICICRFGMKSAFC